MRIGRIIVTLCAGGGIAWLIWVCGVDARFAASFGLLTVVGTLLWECRTDADTPVWDSPAQAQATGARRDVSRLSWSLRASQGRVADTALRRVRVLAARRLARYGLSVDDPTDADAITALVGERGFAIITDTAPRSAERPDIDALIYRLTALPAQEDQ